MLVERVAGAPEIRAAIASQSASLLTDIGIRLTRITEALDDVVERITRRRDPDSETDQAGLATRLLAAAIDLGLLGLVFTLLSSMVASVIPFTFGGRLSLPLAIVLGALAFLVGAAVFVVFWALVGQTPGMRFLAIRITRDGSNDLTLRCAIRRMLGLGLALLPFGLGYFAIARDPRRRGWHDRIAGTEVIYDAVRRSGPHAVQRERGPRARPA
jgi:uncharacterized RDD family membrane protein YckC